MEYKTESEIREDLQRIDKMRRDELEKEYPDYNRVAILMQEQLLAGLELQNNPYVKKI